MVCGVQTRNIFSVKTATRGFLIQTLDDTEFHDWLYAINPLLAGELRSVRILIYLQLLAGEIRYDYNSWRV